jgi:sigma-E factor negative regulatory protein RseA
MNTKNMTQEQISALSDSELSDEHVELALAALRQPDGRFTWDVFHQIGDVLRSDEVMHVFSPDFAARMKERLDAEPTIMAPMPKSNFLRQPMGATGSALFGRSGASFRRFGIPAAAAAVAVVALIASPQLRVAMKGGASPDTMAPIMVVSQARPAASYATVASDSSPSMNGVGPVQNGVILRDPRIDEYLLAHQRFSPSLYSTAQYARSATFASDSDK